MEEFEARLRAFKPRQPGPLPRPSSARPVMWLLVAAAAAAAVALGVRGLDTQRAFVGRTVGNAGRAAPTVGSLTPLALSDPAALDAALDRMSRTLLPDVELPNRALSALGRESK